jgi:hypothetical protein
MTTPQWAWAFEDADGQPVETTISPVFTNQFDAEQWLGQGWREMAATGIASAVLLAEGRPATPAVRLSSEV